MTGINYFLCIKVILISCFSSYGQEWLERIVPLQTTISESGKILNVELPKEADDKYFLKLKEGNLSIWFSKGRCVEGVWGAWDVEKGTIISYRFYPAKERKPAFYKLSSKGMKEQINYTHRIYTSEEKGLSFDVEVGKVRSITMTPATKSENLRCKI